MFLDIFRPLRPFEATRFLLILFLLLCGGQSIPFAVVGCADASRKKKWCGQEDHGKERATFQKHVVHQLLAVRVDCKSRSAAQLALITLSRIDSPNPFAVEQRAMLAHFQMRNKLNSLNMNPI